MPPAWWRGLATLAAVTILAVGCTDEASDPQSSEVALAGACTVEDPDCGDTVAAEEPAPGEGVLDPASGIQRVQMDGTWVFFHDPESSMEALHSGVPEIVDNCLYVDSAVVVWHVDQLVSAQAAIEAVRAGRITDLIIGGGGFSLDEGATAEEIPVIISDVCPTEAVWFASP